MDNFEKEKSEQIIKKTIKTDTSNGEKQDVDPSMEYEKDGSLELEEGSNITTSFVITE